jgi:hypothetical protein
MTEPAARKPVTRYFSGEGLGSFFYFGKRDITIHLPKKPGRPSPSVATLRGWELRISIAGSYGEGESLIYLSSPHYAVNDTGEVFGKFTLHYIFIHKPQDLLRHVEVSREQNDGYVGELPIDTAS